MQCAHVETTNKTFVNTPLHALITRSHNTCICVPISKLRKFSFMNTNRTEKSSSPNIEKAEHGI